MGSFSVWEKKKLVCFGGDEGKKERRAIRCSGWERNLRESGTSWRAVLGKRKVDGRGEGIQLRVSFASLLRFFF